MRKRAVLLGFVLVLCVARAAGADGKDRDALYAEGRTLSEAQRWDEAAEKFRAVIAMRASTKALIALAFVEHKRRHVLEARDLCRQALELAKSSPDQADLELAESSLKDVQSAVPRIYLELPASVRDLHVTVDGKSAVYSSTGLEVDPGRHEIAVTAAGRSPYHGAVDLERGSATLRVELAPIAHDEARTAASPNKDAPAEHPRSVFGPLVLGGVGVVAIAAGSYFVLKGRSDYDAASDACARTKPGCDEDAADRGNSGRSRIITGDVVIGIGAAATAGAIVWWTLGSSKHEAHSPRTRIGTGVGRSGFSLAGRF